MGRPSRADEVGDWLVTLHPRGPDAEGGGTLEILRGDAEDALSALEGWAETFERRGAIPDNGGDFRSQSPIAVIRRAGKWVFACRADCYERETDTGWTTGACYLRAARHYGAEIG